MNYIGSKQSLLPFLEKTILNVCGNDISEFVFCDLFAGTGTVGHYFKLKVKQVISNDLEFYSFVLNRNYIGNSRAIDSFKLLEQLRGVKGVEGFIFQNYAEGGAANRLYFSAENGSGSGSETDPVGRIRNGSETDPIFIRYLVLISPVWTVLVHILSIFDETMTIRRVSTSSIDLCSVWRGLVEQEDRKAGAGAEVEAEAKNYKKVSEIPLLATFVPF